MIWGFVDFRNIEGNEKARPKFVVGIVTLLRDKLYLVFLFTQALHSVLFCPQATSPMTLYQQQIISK